MTINQVSMDGPSMDQRRLILWSGRNRTTGLIGGRLSAFENLTSLNKYACANLTVDCKAVLHGMTNFFRHENVKSNATESSWHNLNSAKLQMG